jgi:molybdopterin-guanine dinucleotide biosynthesis protein A
MPAAQADRTLHRQPVERILSVRPLSSYSPADQSLWFANLNTPEDFAEAEANASALDC